MIFRGTVIYNFNCSLIVFRERDLERNQSFNDFNIGFGKLLMFGNVIYENIVSIKYS